jgi:hypothetical protein
MNKVQLRVYYIFLIDLAIVCKLFFSYLPSFSYSYFGQNNPVKEQLVLKSPRKKTRKYGYKTLEDQNSSDQDDWIIPDIGGINLPGNQSFPERLKKAFLQSVISKIAISITSRTSILPVRSLFPFTRKNIALSILRL